MSLLISGTQPIRSRPSKRTATSGTLLAESLRRRPKRFEPTSLEPTPTQKKQWGMGSLKQAGFSK
eukprot:3464792-Amphidinium_carterae.1